MKVLLVTETIHYGGAETFVLRLANGLNASGIQADVLCLNTDLEDLTLSSQYSDLKILRIKIPLLRWVKRLDRLVRMLKIDFCVQYYLTGKIINRKYIKNYDLFHSHLMPADYMLAGLKKRNPEMIIISTLHGDYNEYEFNWENELPKRKLNWRKKIDLLKKMVNGWVYISQEQFKLFSISFAFAEDKLHLIYNGYTSKYKPSCKFHDPDKRSLSFIMVARGIKEKGWEYLIEAFLLLKGDHQLILIGKGEFLDKLKDKYVQYDRIRFYGVHPNPVIMIDKADVFVFPSFYKAESLPTVLIESLYCGVPVIGSKVGEVENMLKASDNDTAGLLIDVSDKNHIVEHIRSSMERYIQDRQLLKNHSQLAFLAFRKFDMEQCCLQYANLYHKVSNFK